MYVQYVRKACNRNYTSYCIIVCYKSIPGHGEFLAALKLFRIAINKETCWTQFVFWC
jgi:hypothetical protein